MGLLPLIHALAQEASLYQTDFPAAEFQERRSRVFDRIGINAMAVIQGAPVPEGFGVFRQSNEFYYFCGIETPHAYLLLDGRSRRTTLFLPHRDAAREENGAKVLAAEHATEVMRLAGVDAVFGVEALATQLAAAGIRVPPPALYTTFSPAEGVMGSRDETLRHFGELASDPWDGRVSRQAQFVSLLRSRFPAFELRDLSPALDEMRLVKSPREIALIRQASRIAALGVMEAIRSTRPGGFEYQLDAAARYVFLVNGARHEGYPSITASGRNAWMGHYSLNNARLDEGDLVLMDYAPDYHYYTSDATRMWPVSGKYSKDQRDLYGFILAYRNALLGRIRPAVTADQILDEAGKEMQGVLESIPFSKDIYRNGARKALSFRGHLSHPVGMTVHDVGNYRKAPLAPGTVFSIDPMLWVPEEKLYVRMEDTVVVTSTGVENLTALLPARLDEIEGLMKDRGVVQFRPPQPK